MIIQWHHGSGDFATAANWNPASVPGSSDDAEIDAAGTYTVTTSADETVLSLSTIATATLAITGDSGFTITDESGVNAGIIAIDNGSSLDVAGTMANTGKITVNATGMLTGILIASNLTLAGNGKVVLSDSADNVILLLNPGVDLINVGNTISGAGLLTGSDVNLDNNAAGVIDATGITNPLILNTGANIINAGVLEATGAGGLQIDNSVENGLTGFVEAIGSHVVVLITDGAAIVGGTLKTASGGAIDVGTGGAEFDGSMPAAPITNPGNVVVQDDADLTLTGTIDNSGTITLLSSGDPTNLIVGAGGAALEGGGKVTLGGTTFGDEIFSATLSYTLTNVNNFIEGSGALGELGINSLTLVNEAQGVVDAEGAGLAMTINGVNAGLIEATNAAITFSDSAIQNAPTGVIEAIGSLATVIIQDNSDIGGGTLKTADGGTVDVADAIFDGSNPLAPVTIAGNVEVIGGDTLGLFGTIDNSGTITLQLGGAVDFLVGGLGLEGDGKIVLDNAALDGGGLGGALTNADNTIEGSGQLGEGDMILINEAKGVIDAQGVLTLGTKIGADDDNAGLMEATTTGSLDIEHSIIDNAATGIIAAVGTGAEVIIGDGSDIVGGKLEGTGKIIIGFGGAALDASTPAAPITNTGQVVVGDDNTLTLLGTVDNSGTIALDSSGDPTNLIIGSAGVALEGNGKVILEGAPGDAITGATASDTLTNINNTISGFGILGAAHMTLINETDGVIDAIDGTLDVNTGNTVVNAGLMETTTGDLLFSDFVSNTGTIKSDGLPVTLGNINNNGALIAENGELTIDGNDFGAGSATIDNGGEIQFGFVAGILQNITFANNGSADATLAFDDPASANPDLIYDGLIFGFSTVKDQIDFTGLTFDGGTTPDKTLVDGNTVLTVTEGADSVSVTLAGNHMSDHFTISADSGTGTLITDPPTGMVSGSAVTTLASTANIASPSATNIIGASNVALLGSYMASLFASVEGQVTAATTEPVQNQAVLAHAHMA